MTFHYLSSPQTRGTQVHDIKTTDSIALEMEQATSSQGFFLYPGCSSLCCPDLPFEPFFTHQFASSGHCFPRLTAWSAQRHFMGFQP